MTIRQLLYLAQLEEYDRERIVRWLKEHPGKSVEEKKKHLVWTTKVALLFALTLKYSLVLSKERAVLAAIRTLEPIDTLIKRVVVGVATAKLRLFHRHLKVIGVAGSWGKTTAKETLTVVLSKKFHVEKTPENTNTLMGIAKVVMNLPKAAQMFICEMDAFVPGEIASVCRLIRPQIGLLCAIGPMHLERFHDDFEALVSAQFELLESLPASGFGCFPKEYLEVIPKVRAKTFAFSSVDEAYSKIVQRFGLTAEDVVHAKVSMQSIPHRAQVIQANGLTIIDDAYNSNPAGFRRALQKLADAKATKRILVTPGMIEMGKMQSVENKEAAKEAAKVCDVIIVVGETNKNALMEGAKGVKKLIWVKNLEDAQKELAAVAVPGTAVLFENDLGDQYT